MRRRCTAREADDTTHAPRSSYDRWSAGPATPPAPAPAVQPRPQSISAAWARLTMRRGFLAASSDSGAAAEGGRTVQRSPRPASLSSWLGPTFECEEPPGCRAGKPTLCGTRRRAALLARCALRFPRSRQPSSSRRCCPPTSCSSRSTVWRWSRTGSSLDMWTAVLEHSAAMANASGSLNCSGGSSWLRFKCSTPPTRTCKTQLTAATT